MESLADCVRIMVDTLYFYKKNIFFKSNASFLFTHKSLDNQHFSFSNKPSYFFEVGVSLCTLSLQLSLDGGPLSIVVRVRNLLMLVVGETDL